MDPRRRLRLETLEVRRVLATFLVTTASDVVDQGDGVTSLREAIESANLAAGPDTIQFDTGVFATPTKIHLQLGQLEVTDGLTVLGPGRHLLTIDARAQSRVIDFTAATADLALVGVSLTGGLTTAADIQLNSSGGAIRFLSGGALSLSDASVLNSATRGDNARGGGIFAQSGNLILNRSIVSGNQTSGVQAKGGGIFAGAGTVVLSDSEVSGNSTSQRDARGGGIYSSGNLVTLIRSKLRDNVTLGPSADGGALFTTQGVSLDASVISGNSTTGEDADGGAIFAQGLLAVVRSDVSGNTTRGRYSAGGALVGETATVIINDSSITGNRITGPQAYGAGMLAVRSDVTISGSTISSNVATGIDTDGGGVSAFFSSVSINSSTIAFNATTGEGGGVAFVDNTGKLLQIQNSIVAGNRDLGVAPDFLAPVNPLLLNVRFSLIGDNTGTTLGEAQSPDANRNFVGAPGGGGIIDPLLDPLILIGNTRVHPLRPGSPAVGAGSNALVMSIPTDQRGRPFARIANPIVDMGSYELQTLSPSLFVVTTPDDELDFTNSDVSLREAIIAAGGTAGPDVITFEPFLFAEPQQIRLTLGELTINESVAIEGRGSRLLTIDAQGGSRVIDVTAGNVDVRLSGLTIRGGATTAAGDSGGGVRFQSSGTLTLRDSVVSGNRTGGEDARGGGIYASGGAVILDRSIVTGNATLGAGASGGGIHVAGTLTAIDSTISDNRTSGAAADGGGVLARGVGGIAVNLTRSTIAGNAASGSASRGGGIATTGGAITLHSSTLSGNTAARDGGGIFVAPAAAAQHVIVFSTLAGNHSGGSGGGASLASDSTSRLRLENSIAATNSAAGSAPDIDLRGFAGVRSVRGSLLGDNTGTGLTESRFPDSQGNLVGAANSAGGVIDPLLGPLRLRGGLTATHSLRSGSPAIDAGDASLLGMLDSDQRGDPFVRLAGRAPDMGSFETQVLDGSFLAVNTSVDELDFTNNALSLREALAFAAGSEGLNTIEFDPAVFSQATSIDLHLGELEIVESVNIRGPGAHLLSIDAQQKSRVFQVSTGSIHVTLSGMTVSGGRTTGDNQQIGGVLESTHSGGAIRFDALGSLRLEGVTVANNRTQGKHASGGAIFVSRGELTILASTIDNNATQGDAAEGGGIYVADSRLAILDSHVQDNSTSGAASPGGGVAALDTVTTLTRSDLRGNLTMESDSPGGGIHSRGGQLTVVGSELSDNETAGADSTGGGIDARGATVLIAGAALVANRTSGNGSAGGGIALAEAIATIHNSTLSGNSTSGLSAPGGAIEAGQDTDVTIVQATVTANTVGGQGGGISVAGDLDNQLSIANSIIAGNVAASAAHDLRPPLNLDGLIVRSSLIGDNSGTLLVESRTADAQGNLIGSSAGGGVIDPLLGPLANNGGPTRTHTLRESSPAIHAGSNALAVDADAKPLVSDQRAEPFLRFFGAVDMGAFELQPPRSPIIVWPDPANIFVGTALGDVQLNASTDTAGTFVYTPPTGTILDLGDAQILTVQFTPDDTVNYQSTSASVQIDVVERSDLGDAPDSYATLRASNGPRHLVGSLLLGEAVDAEVDGQPGPGAEGDGADDDGVLLITGLVADPFAATTASIRVTASRRAKLDAWIDFDRDGVFDPTAEHLGGGTSLDVFDGVTILPFTIPSTAVPGPTFARFRVSSAGDLDPTGEAADGEVEDYAVTLLDGAADPTVGIAFTAGPLTLLVDAGDVVAVRRSQEQFRAAISNVGRLEIQGDELSNVLTIDNAGGQVIPSRGLSFDGAGRVNTVRLLGPDHAIDLSRSGNVSLRNVDVIDISDAAASAIRIDAIAARAMDPTGGGVVIVGSPGDTIAFADGEQWRMAAPVALAGLSFSTVRLADTFVQVDFASPWQNLAQPSDVNNDGNVTSVDALRIINELARRVFSDPVNAELADPSDVSPWPNVYFDQNGDRKATALDALRVINELARRANGAGEGESLPASASVVAAAGDTIVHVPAAHRQRHETGQGLQAPDELPAAGGRIASIAAADSFSGRLPGDDSSRAEWTVDVASADESLTDPEFLGELQTAALDNRLLPPG